MPYFYSGPPRSVRIWRGIYARKVESKICPDSEEASHGLYLPLTLDEYCNSTLDDDTLNRRNKDQVVVRSAMRQQHGGYPNGAPKGKQTLPTARLLMVHQLWIYRFGKGFVVAFPDVVLQERTIRQALSQHSKNPLVRVFEWLRAFIGLLERHIGLHRPVLDIFEESISAASNDVEEYFKLSIKEQEKAADDEKQFSHVIADIREELSMIQSVITQQDRVWTDLREEIIANWLENDVESPADENGSMVPEQSERHSEHEARIVDDQESASDHEGPVKPERTERLTKHEAKIIDKMSLQLQRLKERINKADRDAERVQTLIPQYLELKRSYTVMKESHYTALLGAAVFGFSIVTIIFTPLSFMMALLAVPNDSLLVGPVADGRKKLFVGRWTCKPHSFCRWA